MCICLSRISSYIIHLIAIKLWCVLVRTSANALDSASKNTNVTTEWLLCEEVYPGNENETIIKDIFTNCQINTRKCEELCVKYFSTIDVLNILRASDECENTKTFSVLNADQGHSDLKTAIYEGGLKIWECTYDLINYIIENNLRFKSKKVLDLGCGTGLIGIVCLLKGASCTFQDYNAEVLQYITIPNVQLNDEKFLKDCKFYSGDWQSFCELFTMGSVEDKFDYIFTSETIYNTENYSKLHNTFREVLNKNGEIYLAAKSNYFGVGGGISLFEDFLKSKEIFRSSSCWICSRGVKREILKITFI